MDFCNLSYCNLAMLKRQAWRILSTPNIFVSGRDSLRVADKDQSRFDIRVQGDQLLIRDANFYVDTPSIIVASVINDDG